MKLFIKIMMMMAVAVSCSGNEDADNTVIQKPNLTGTWKPQRYEYKGKIYPLSQCEKQGQILINVNLSGVYENYGAASSGENCNLLDSFSGIWSYDEFTKDLVLTYNESGAVKTLKKEIVDFSENELKITDTSKNLDNIPGNDEASLVFVKQ